MIPTVGKNYVVNGRADLSHDGQKVSKIFTRVIQTKAAKVVPGSSESESFNRSIRTELTVIRAYSTLNEQLGVEPDSCSKKHECCEKSAHTSQDGPTRVWIIKIWLNVVWGLGSGYMCQLFRRHMRNSSVRHNGVQSRVQGVAVR
jgi:hypothetical protein